MSRPKNIKASTPPPRRRNGNAIAAIARKGAGAHKVAKKDVVTEADWEAADYSKYGKGIDMSLTLQEFRNEHCIENGSEMMTALEQWATDDAVPALCKDGCQVEPDGHCEHGCPSILVRMGVI
jgi:hypothetical protein